MQSALFVRQKPRHIGNMTDSPALPNLNWPDFRPGWVWLCGAGPGDPGLLTLHGLHALRQADVVVHDALIDMALLNWAPQAEHINVGKRGGTPSPKQHEISQKLIDLAHQNKRVLRLKGGDPYVFGRGGEEAQTLVQNGVPFRLIPGISAGIGGLAYAGIPATHRDANQSVTFVTGHDMSGNTPSLDWQAISKGSETIIIYMGMRHIGKIATALRAAGRPADEPAAVVCAATTPEQRVLETTLGHIEADIAAADLCPPAIICIGRSVLMRQALDWQALLTGEQPRNTDPLEHGATTQK